MCNRRRRRELVCECREVRSNRFDGIDGNRNVELRCRCREVDFDDRNDDFRCRCRENRRSTFPLLFF